MTTKASLIVGDCPRAAAEILMSGARFDIIKVHDSFKVLNMLHDVWGDNTRYVMRITSKEYIIDNGVSSWADPKVVAQRWVQAMQSFFAQAPYAYFEVGGPGFNTDDPAFAAQYAKTIMEAMRLMEQAGIKGVVLTFYEGTPHTLSDGSGIDGWAPYRPVINLAAQLGFMLGMQGYWVDGKMDMADDWHNFRLVRVMRDYPDLFPPGTQIFKSESRIDLRNGKGWKSALGNRADLLMDGIKKEDEFWSNYKFPPGVEFLGFTDFILQEWGKPPDWDDFNLWEVLPYLLPYVKNKMSVIEVPPGPAPEPINTRTVIVSSEWGCNHRASPSINSAQLGYITQGTRLIVEYPAINSYVRVLDKGYVYAPNLTIIGG